MNHALQHLEPPFTLETIRGEIAQLNHPQNYVDIVKPPDGGDNEVLHIIKRQLIQHRTQPQDLLVIGSKHRTDHSHWYYRDYLLLMNDWERRTRDMGRRVLIREGAFPFWTGMHSEVDPVTSIATSSDSGLANVFARAHDIPMISGDFPYYGDIVAQAELHPERIEEIITYYTMREIPIYARMETKDVSLEAFFKQRLELLQRNMGKVAMTTYVPDTLDFSYDTVIDLHKKFFNGEEPNLGLAETYLDYTVADIGDEELRRKDVARVAIDRMNLSDAHLLLTIEHELRQGRDVMTIFGNHHTLSICNALRAHGRAVPLPRYPARMTDLAKRASWNEQNRTEEFQESTLAYPSRGRSQSINGGVLESYMQPKKMKAEHLSKYTHVWPNLVYEKDPLFIGESQVQGIKALAGLEEARQFEDNDYITQVCQEPLEWVGDMPELFQLLESIGEDLLADPELVGRNEDFANLREVDPFDIHHVKLLPTPQMILATAERRIKAVFPEGQDTELSEWFNGVCRSIEHTCFLKNLPATYAFERVNIITKQVAGLCSIFRTVPAFCELDLTSREQCSYALSFLAESLKGDFWPLKRLDRIVELPYHVLPEYVEE